jgi:hypothetical protein
VMVIGYLGEFYASSHLRSILFFSCTRAAYRTNTLIAASAIIFIKVRQRPE